MSSPVKVEESEEEKINKYHFNNELTPEDHQRMPLLVLSSTVKVENSEEVMKLKEYFGSHRKVHPDQPEEYEVLGVLQLDEEGTEVSIVQKIGSEEEYIKKTIMKGNFKANEVKALHKTQQLLSVGIKDDKVEIIMKLIKGRTLSDIFNEKGVIFKEQKKLLELFVLYGIDEGLQCLSKLAALGFHHGDIKADNVFVEDKAGSGIAIHLIDYGDCEPSKDGCADTFDIVLLIKCFENLCFEHPKEKNKWPHFDREKPRKFYNEKLAEVWKEDPMFLLKLQALLFKNNYKSIRGNMAPIPSADTNPGLQSPSTGNLQSPADTLITSYSDGEQPDLNITYRERESSSSARSSISSVDENNMLEGLDEVLKETMDMTGGCSSAPVGSKLH